MSKTMIFYQRQGPLSISWLSGLASVISLTAKVLRVYALDFSQTVEVTVRQFVCHCRPFVGILYGSLRLFSFQPLEAFHELGGFDGDRHAEILSRNTLLLRVPMKRLPVSRIDKGGHGVPQISDGGVRVKLRASSLRHLGHDEPVFGSTAIGSRSCRSKTSWPPEGPECPSPP